MEGEWYSYSFLDYVPEYRLGVFYKSMSEKVNKESDETVTRYVIYIVNFAQRPFAFFEIKDPKFIMKASPSFFTRIISKITFYTGREQKIAQIIVRTEMGRYSKERDEHVTDYTFAVVSVPLDDFM